MRILLSAGVLLAALSIGSAQDIAPSMTEDSDHDGLRDALKTRYSRNSRLGSW